MRMRGRAQIQIVSLWNEVVATNENPATPKCFLFKLVKHSLPNSCAFSNKFLSVNSDYLVWESPIIALQSCGVSWVRCQEHLNQKSLWGWCLSVCVIPKRVPALMKTSASFASPSSPPPMLQRLNTHHVNGKKLAGSLSHSEECSLFKGGL